MKKIHLIQICLGLFLGGIGIAQWQTMVFIRCILTLFLSFNYSQPAEAAISKSELLANVKALESQIQNKIVKKGVQSIGGVNLENTLKNMQKVTVLEIHDGIPLGSCGRRMGAVNLFAEKQVALPMAFLKEAIPDDVFSLWLLHEKYEAAGSFDENYGSTVGLAWLSGLDSKSDRQWLIESSLLPSAFDEKQVVAECSIQFLPIVSGGGSTGVGGGGDPYSIAIKRELLNKFYNAYLQTKKTSKDKDRLVNLLSFVLTMSLEPNYKLVIDLQQNDLVAYQKDLQDLQNSLVTSEISLDGKLTFEFMTCNFFEPSMGPTILNEIVLRLANLIEIYAK